MQRFTRPLRQLHGKLTLSYTLTSVVAFLFIELIFIGVVLWFVSFNLPGILLSDLQKEAPQMAPYFIHGTPDHQELTAGLQVVYTDLPTQGPPGQSHTLMFLVVVNTQGQVLASLGSQPIPLNTSLQGQLSAQSRANLQAVLNDSQGMTSKVNVEADGSIVAATPVVGSSGRVQGVLVMKSAKPDILLLLSDFLGLIIVSSLIVTIIAAIAGMIFGHLTARGITRRLKTLAGAAERWSQGNFAIPAHDTSMDELGQTSRQLNRMAKQLQNLLQTRQKLATLEERNRLARDLHDSVKQQIFAVAMQLRATKVLLRRDVDAAEVRLLEAEKLVRQAQQELTSLIRELRPIVLEGKGLVAALRELATSWAQQTEIVANLQAEDIHPLPLTVEEALFRVAQEALSNVARHSKATLVQMILTTTDDTVMLSIIDNGAGFDSTRQEGAMGVGLLSMQERMKALGGDVQLESTPGKGTRVVAQCNRLGTGTSEVTNTESAVLPGIET